MRFQWGGTFEQFARNYVRDNRWRVRRYLADDEDGVQQCACLFAHCNNRYHQTVDNEKWFMSLYTTSVRRYFVDLQRRERRARLAELTYRYRTANTKSVSFDNLLAADESMSDELRAVLSIIANGPGEMLAMLLDCRPDRDTEKLSQRWRQLLDTPGTTDLVKELLDLLGQF